MSTRVAVVTGAGSGIGAATVRALAADGWTVVLAGRRREALDAAAQEALPLDAAAQEAVVQARAQEPGAALPPAQLRVVPTDVTDEGSVRALFEQTVAELGRVDLLVNNAGTFLPSRELHEVPLAEWQAALDVNLTGVFLCTREAFRVMRAQFPPGGRIINNGSISAHVPRPNAVAYTASKSGVTGLTRATALDGRRYDIACGQIDVGNAATDMTDAMARGVAQADGSVRPEARMDVADVARAVVYMASLPLDANVLSLTVHATQMPFVGRG